MGVRISTSAVSPFKETAESQSFWVDGRGGKFTGGGTKKTGQNH